MQFKKMYRYDTSYLDTAFEVSYMKAKKRKEKERNTTKFYKKTTCFCDIDKHDWNK